MGLLSRTKVWVSGEILTASDLNAEFDNVLDNGLVNDKITGSSVDVTAMRVVEDPGEVGTESLASSNEGEIRRLRNVLKEITAEAQWYVTPSRTLADGQGDTAYLATGAVTADKLATNAVTTVKINAQAVTTSKLGNGVVTANELGTNAVTNAKIIDGSVTTAKLGALAVTRAKQEAVGEQLGASSGSLTSTDTSGTLQAFSGGNISITTSGRPIMITIQPDSVGPFSITGPGGDTDFRIVRDTTNTIATWDMPDADEAIFPSSFLLSIVAGTYNFKFGMTKTQAGTFAVTNAKISLYEL